MGHHTLILLSLLLVLSWLPWEDTSNACFCFLIISSSKLSCILRKSCLVRCALFLNGDSICLPMDFCLRRFFFFLARFSFLMAFFCVFRFLVYLGERFLNIPMLDFLPLPGDYFSFPSPLCLFFQPFGIEIWLNFERRDWFRDWRLCCCCL